MNPQLNGALTSMLVDPAHTWIFMDTEFRHLHKAEVVFADEHLEEMVATP